MLDRIKTQYKSRKTMNQGRYYNLMRKDGSHPMMNEMYPYAIEYYHELNPYFLANILRKELYDFCPIITVRDGMIPFASFIAKNFQGLETLETGFLIHPKLAPLVPPQLRDRFLSWHISQRGKRSISEAKNVLVTGLMNSDCTGPKSELSARLEILRQVKPEAKIDFFLPMRKSPLEANWKEFYTGYEVVEMIKKVLPDRTLNFMTSRDLVDRSSFTGTYLLDLFVGEEIIADKSMGHIVANRGGWVEEFSDLPPAESLMDIELSFTHTLHVINLPEVTSVYSDLIIYKKLNPSPDLMTDPGFQKLIRDIVS